MRHDVRRGPESSKCRSRRLNVSEYHRPYVAIWVEREDQSIAANLAVWYQTEEKKEDGTQWLKDLRQWWRRGGRGETLPIDGVTGATRPVGEHSLQLQGQRRKPLTALAPGKYNVVVEAAREVGGRELLRCRFEWPAKQASARNRARQDRTGHDHPRCDAVSPIDHRITHRGSS